MNTNCFAQSVELARLASHLQAAASPEVVFGSLSGPVDQQLVGVKRAYRQLAKAVHPDYYPCEPDRSLAQAAFLDLTRWYTLAEASIRRGTYGQAPDANTVHLRSRRQVYSVSLNSQKSGLYHCYPCQFEVHGHITLAEIRIVRRPQDNDLALNEINVLQILHNGLEADKFSAYIPRLFDSFLYEDGGEVRQAFVTERLPGWYSLAQVHAAYPGGVDPKDMAWIFRRLLVAAGFAHRNSILHAALLPKNIFILPEAHGLLLTNWSAALYAASGTGACVGVVDSQYLEFYPPEVIHKEPPLPAMDVYMAAKCMVELLGGDPCTGALPDLVPQPIRMFFKGCLLPGKSMRPQDAWELVDEFDDLLHRLWGKRKFHPFRMP